MIFSSNFVEAETPNPFTAVDLIILAPKTNGSKPTTRPFSQSWAKIFLAS